LGFHRKICNRLVSDTAKIKLVNLHIRVRRIFFNTQIDGQGIGHAWERRGAYSILVGKTWWTGGLGRLEDNIKMEFK